MFVNSEEVVRAFSPALDCESHQVVTHAVMEYIRVDGPSEASVAGHPMGVAEGAEGALPYVPASWVGEAAARVLVIRALEYAVCRRSHGVGQIIPAVIVVESGVVGAPIGQLVAALGVCRAVGSSEGPVPSGQELIA